MKIVFQVQCLTLKIVKGETSTHEVELPERATNVQVDVVPSTQFADPVGVVSYYQLTEEEWAELRSQQARAAMGARGGLIT